MTAGSTDIDNAVSAPGLGAGQLSFTQIMRERTHSLHARAERSGIVNDVLRSKASRFGYALLLRNLLPAYQQLEAGLEAHRLSPAVRAASCRELYRAPALASDLAEIAGHDWENALPLLAAGEQYGRCVAVAAKGDGTRLIAHAYTRYMGDLNGGQVMKRLLARSPGLRQQELSFYDFPQIEETEVFKKSYRLGLDDSATLIADIDAVVGEAVTAFELNIAVSEAVQQASAAAV
jgi:heme oxygenase (biliverdin-producing, ferredoxin)